MLPLHPFFLKHDILLIYSDSDISLSLLVFKYFMTERHCTTVEENLSSQANSKILGVNF